MQRPNFFIAGAPKCGTTALSEYLKGHPSVFMSTPKEPHYFATDLPGHRSCKTLEEYLALFSDANEHHLAVGEASVHYLYSQDAIRNIRDFNPDARLIVMLRDPIEMVYSMHSQALASRNEDVEDFEAAWELEAARARGDHIPKYCRDVKILYYSQIARYAKQLNRLYRHFPEGQVKVILFEDFKSDTRGVYKSVLEFLGIPDDKRESFQVINANKKARNSLLADFSQRPPRGLTALARQAKRVFGIERLGVLNTLRRYNFVTCEREPLREGAKLKIVVSYRKDVKELSEMLGRDLGRWLQG